MHRRLEKSTTFTLLHTPIRCALLATAFLAVTALLACRPEPAEVETAALTDGDLLAEADQGSAEVAVREGGPAAWSCGRYLDLSDDAGQHFDAESADAAESFADDLFRAAEATEGETLVRPDVPLRTALRDACSEREDVTLAEVLRETFGEGAA